MLISRSCSRLPGGRAAFRPAPPFCRRRERLALISIPSVAGVPVRTLSGRCRQRRIRQARHHLSADSLCGVTAVEKRYADKKGLAAGRRLSCQSTLQSGCRHRCSAGKPGSQPACPQGCRRPPDRHGSDHPALPRRGPRTDMHEPSGDFGVLSRRSRASGRTGSAARFPVICIFFASFSRCCGLVTGR